MRAAEAGKQVAVLVEVQARFDEANNIEWARVLEDAGAHVAFGLPGLKTHAKTALVVRDEGDAVRTYVHLGTGNYNPSTARLYTDLGLLSADEMLGRDVAQLFHVLTGYATDAQYRRLLVAPRDLRPRVLDLIRRETRLGTGGRIVAKMNALEDTRIVRALYEGRPGGRRDRPRRPRPLPHPARPAGAVRDHPRPLDRRALSGARPHLLVRQRRLARGLYRLRGLAVAQPRRPRRGDRAGHGRAPPRATLRAVLGSCLRDDVLAWTLGPDGRYSRLAPGANPHDHQQTMMHWATQGGAPRSARTKAL